MLFILMMGFWGIFINTVPEAGASLASPEFWHL